MKTYRIPISIIVLALVAAACGSAQTPAVVPTTAPARVLLTAAPTTAPAQTSTPPATLPPTAIPATDAPEQSMTISDQSVSAGMMTIGELVVVRPSWVVIHPDKNGSPNFRTNVGRIVLPTGRHESVVITLDLARVTPLLYAEIHDDLGLPGQFDVFDQPAQPLVIVPFNVTLP